MKRLQRSVLASMVGLCVYAMAAGPVLAQSANGAIAGRGEPGSEISIVNQATGQARSVTVRADGSYRVGQLPVGDYRLQVMRDGREQGQPVNVNVALGGTTTVNLSDAGTTLDTVQVIGSRIVNRVDVRSTESATNMTREELTRLPVDQNMGAVALLAPGVIGGNSSFGGISFGGSSVAENSVFINGLNVTDFYRRQSFSAAPYGFFREFQVKTGGYSVEFGRSTGGVINAVSRSGSNEFHGGVEVTYEPQWGREAPRDRFYADGSLRQRGSHDRQDFIKTNVWGSGPIVKDRLFFFAMYEDRGNRSYFTNNSGSTISKSKDDGDGFWGAKIDWNINDDHSVALLAFSDETTTAGTSWAYDFDRRTRTALQGSSTAESGGLSWSAAYTGRFGENFTAKAMYGINGSQSFNRSPADAQCDIVTYNTATYGAAYNAMGRPALGCHPGGSVISHDDKRKVMRLDFEWALGNHLLRFGVDREVMTTDRTTRYPGPNQMLYTAFGTTPGAVLDNGATVPADVNAIMMARRRIDGGVFETSANAYYLEDIWSVTPNLLLNLGVRVDNFDNKTAVGSSFIKIDNLVSPRLGFSWDMKGDGTRKLFGNLGRYYLPVTNNINYTFAGGLTDERTFYALNGWSPQTNPVTGAPYMAPVLGAQIGPVDDSYNIGVADLRQSVDRDIDAVYQDEAILGFQSMLNQAWSWGVNATYRRMQNALDDIRINHTPCGPLGFSLWPIANPGKPLTIWGDQSLGCATDGWITIDTSRDGYQKLGSNEVVGYAKPRRSYKAVEFQIDRAWDEKWSFNASYLWSKSEGNHEGPVNSDTNYGDTGMVQHWDHPAGNARHGVLFNDRRHQIKLRSTYAFNENWSVGGTLSAASGGPITAFGVAWPGDSRGAASFVTEGSGGGSAWICVENCSGNYANRVFRYSPQGEYGRLPWTWTLGANLAWQTRFEQTDFRVRFSVFNITNNQTVINVHSRYEAAPGVYRPTFGQGTRWQSPRYAQLVVSWSF